MSFEVLLEPFEAADGWLAGSLDGAPLLVALAIAVVLGLRHASDPDHLVAVTSLVAAERGDVRGAARLGAWWGLGHAAVLLAAGVPLIALHSQLPGWLERGAETGIGLVILALALRVIGKWIRGDYRARGHAGGGHARPRSRAQALAIGMLHGLAGTGAVVVLLIAGIPGRAEAAAALAVFAPMSIASMAAWTGAFAWVLTRRAVEPLYRSVLIPVLGGFGLLFGLWYAGIT